MKIKWRIGNTPIVWIIYVFCFITAQVPVWNRLPLDRLTEAKGVSEAGQLLIQQPLGWTEITYPSTNYDTLWIVVHGYGSRGYEWVDAIKDFCITGKGVFFYRYDWSRCPEDIVDSLSHEFPELIHHITPQPEHVIVFGHSYGALIVAMLNACIDLHIPMEFHAIAGPLAGMKGFQDRCTWDQSWIAETSQNGTGMRLHQWRTVKSQDGAFRDAERDPQDVNIPGSTVIQLPKVMDGHRLGHNWSVLWVVETYLGLRSQ